MKPIKIIAIALGCVIVVVGGVTAYIAASFDATRIKAELTKTLQEKQQRKLNIEGELSLSFFPSLGVKLGKTSISERNSTEIFASLESARLSVRLMPLLSKQVEVEQISLVGLDAKLIKRADGSLNIADLLGGGGAKADKAPNKPTDKATAKDSPAAMKLDVAGIKISNSQISWFDEKTGKRSSVSALDFESGRIAGSAGGGFSVEKLKLGFKGKQDDENFEVQLAAPQLMVSADKAGGSSVNFSAKLEGAKRSAYVKLDLSDVQGSAAALKIGKIALALDAKSGESSVKGTLSGAIDANLQTQVFDLPKLVGELEIASPAMPMKQLKLPLELGIHADLGKEAMNAQLSTRFDESKIVAQANVKDFTPLGLSFEVDIDRLNLDKYLPPKSAHKAAERTTVPATPAPSGNTSAGTEEKINLAALKSLNLHGKLKVGSLQVRNVKASEVRLELNAAGGKLELIPVANLYGGSTNGKVVVNSLTNAFSVKQSFSGININPLLKDAISRDMLDGRGNVALDVTTQGDTVTALKKALAGTAQLSLKDGAVKGINLAKSFRDAKAKFSGKQDSSQQANAADKTDFSDLTASFRINHGIAHNDDLAAKSPFLRLAGNGDIDIGNSSINYLAKASVVNTSGGQGAQDLAHLSGLTVPVRLTGPFDNLSYKLELSALATEAVKAKVEEKKQVLKEKVADKLKGLFNK